MKSTAVYDWSQLKTLQVEVAPGLRHIPINKLAGSSRLRRILSSALGEYATCADLARLTYGQLLQVSGCGRKTLNELRFLLTETPCPCCTWGFLAEQQTHSWNCPIRKTGEFPERWGQCPGRHGVFIERGGKGWRTLHCECGSVSVELRDTVVQHVYIGDPSAATPVTRQSAIFEICMLNADEE